MPAAAQRRRPSPRALALAVYVAALVGYVVQVGVPFDRSLQTLWLLAGMAAAQVGRGWRRYARMMADWLPFLAALLVYDYTRGVADTLGRPVLVGGLVEADRAIAAGAVPTVTLQDRFYDPATVHWYDVVASVVYASHFVVPWVLAAVLYVRSRDAWLGYARRILVLTFAGLVTYALVPAAPPWYAAKEGLLADVDRIATRGWSTVGLHSAGRLIEDGQADVNLVAALPSLHAGTAMLVALWAWPRLSSGLARAGVVGYAVAMGLTLVYGGEHYVVDVLLGWVYAAAAVLACRLWERRRPRRDATVAATVAAAGSGRRAPQAPDNGAGRVDVLRPHQHA